MSSDSNTLDKSQNSVQHSPAVPPGLESISTNNLPFSRPPDEHSSIPPTTPLSILPQTSDLTPRQVSPNLTPITTTSLGRQIINTIRRAPSMSATRPSGSTVVNGGDKRSLADKSPRLSGSSPVFIDSSGELPPPVPPLPPNILASPPPPSPSAFATSVNDPQKEERGKERDKSKTGGNWFSKKRKSLRLGERGGKHESALGQIPSSPFIVTEESYSQLQHTGWFNRTNSSTGAPKSQRTSGAGTSSDVPDSHVSFSRRGSSTHDRRPNGLEDFPRPSRSSSPSSTSLPIHGQGFGVTTSQPPPSMSASSATPDSHHPSRNSPLATSLEISQSSIDRKKSFDRTPLYHPISSSPNPSDHPLPPLPPSYLDPHRSAPSNGHLPSSDPESTPIDKTGRDHTPLSQPASNTSLRPPVVSRSATLPSTSMNMPMDAGDINPLEHFQTSRSPPRKLSLTTPILAFGRKDREREKR